MMLARNAACVVLLFSLLPAIASAATQPVSIDRSVSLEHRSQAVGYPVVASPALQRLAPVLVRSLSGARAELRRQSEQHAWLWYDDGHVLFLYTPQEIRHAIVPLRYTSLSALQRALDRIGVSDPRYPIHQGVNLGPVYMAAPPVYVDMVLNIAAYLDQYGAPMEWGGRVVVDVPLFHLPVCSQSSLLPKSNVISPGILPLLQQSFSIDKAAISCSSDNISDLYIDMSAISNAPTAIGAFDPAAKLPGYLDRNTTVKTNELRFRVRVLPRVEGNGLQLEGPIAQVMFLRNLIRQIDASPVLPPSGATVGNEPVSAVLRALAVLHRQLSAPASR